MSCNFSFLNVTMVSLDINPQPLPLPFFNVFMLSCFHAFILLHLHVFIQCLASDMVVFRVVYTIVRRSFESIPSSTRRWSILSRDLGKSFNPFYPFASVILLWSSFSLSKMKLMSSSIIYHLTITSTSTSSLPTISLTLGHVLHTMRQAFD